MGKVNGNGTATAAALDALVEASDAGTTTAEQTDLLRTVWQQDAVALPVMVTGLTGENHAKLAALAQSNATALADDVTGRLGRGVLVDASSTRIEQLLWANIGYGDVSVDADASADRFDARQRRATAGIDVYRSSNVAWGAGWVARRRNWNAARWTTRSTATRSLPMAQLGQVRWCWTACCPTRPIAGKASVRTSRCRWCTVRQGLGYYPDGQCRCQPALHGGRPELAALAARQLAEG